MGFFFKTEVVEDTIAKPARVKATASAKKLDVSALVIGCESCALKPAWGTMSSPRMVMSYVNKEADILVLGASPNEIEDMQGAPFLGPEGKLFKKRVGGKFNDRMAYQNVVRCRPPKDRSITLQESYACSQHLSDDVAKLPIKAIIGIGPVPLQRFWPGVSIMRVHGQRFPVKLGDKTVWYYPVLSPGYLIANGGERSAAYSAFASDLKRFFDAVDKWGTPKVHSFSNSQVLLPKTEQEARDIIARFQPDIPLGADIESNSHLRPNDRGARLITAALSDYENCMAFPVDFPGHPCEWGMRVLVETVSKRMWIAHNANLELTWFNHFAPNVDIADFHDSQALARIDYNRETIQSLAEVSHVELGVNIKSYNNINTKLMNNYTLDEVLPYNGLDAFASSLIYRNITRRRPATDRNYVRLLESIRSTSNMQLLGLPVDFDASRALKKEWGDKVEKIKADASKLYEVRQFENTKQQPFNLGSTDDVGEALVIFGKLKLPEKHTKGKTTYTTDEAALTKATEHLEGGSHPLVTAVTDFREATKQISTYIDPLLEVPLIYEDGLVHPNYTVLLTSTGRLSSTDPNVQNFPKRRHREVRRQIVPPKGYGFYAFDYGQLEARVLAMASKDRMFCESILKGFDIHSYWRDKVLDIYPEYIERLKLMTNQTELKKIMKGGRDVIKTDLVFASFYGAMPGSVAARTQIPMHTVNTIMMEFWKDYAGVLSWIKARRKEYDDTGTARTLTGRSRVGILWGNEPINTPIQGTAADVVSDAMNALSRLSVELKEPCLHPRINIHDDLSFFLPDSDDLPDFIELITETMLEVRYPWQVVPFVVEASTGDNWCDLNEFGVFTGGHIR